MQVVHLICHCLTILMHKMIIQKCYEQSATVVTSRRPQGSVVSVKLNVVINGSSRERLVIM